MSIGHKAIALFVMLAMMGCGGGDSSQAAPPVATPSPTPPLPTPSFVQITAAGAQPILAQVRFYPTGFNINAADQYSHPTDRTGRYPGPNLILMNGVGIATGDYAAQEKLIYGIDTAGAFYVQGQAPADSLVISPLTHLLVSGNTQERLKVQLGIRGSLFGLEADRDLKTFSPTTAIESGDSSQRADGERLLAHHLRVQMLVAALRNFVPREPDPVDSLTFVPSLSYVPGSSLARSLENAPASFIYSNDSMLSLLKSFPGIGGGGYSDLVLSAAAHLMNAYAAAIPVRVSSREQAARFMMGIKGYLVPELVRLLGANSPATANEVLSITSAEILSQTSRYGEQLPFDVNDSYFPSPDFYTLPRGGSKLVDATDIGFYGDGPFTDNDLHLRATDTSTPFQPGGGSLASVAVPPVNAQEVAATLNPDGTVLIQAGAGFAGVTYFDYTTRHPRGDVEQGRVYVRVRN